MMIEDLEKILKEIPILLVPTIKIQYGNKIKIAEGLAIQKQRDDGSVLKYTALSYQCDDLARGLLHESIHHYSGGSEEWYVKQLENKFWKDPEYRKICQNKIIEQLGRFDL